MRTLAFALVVTALVVTALAPGLGRAQTNAEPPVRPPVERFEVEQVTGLVVGPRLRAADVVPEKRHLPESLIRVRTEFRSRLLASAGAL